MITEENRNEVTMLLREAETSANKFSALSLAIAGIEDDEAKDSIVNLMVHYASEADRHFKRIATLLGYTVSKVEMEDAGQ